MWGSWCIYLWVKFGCLCVRKMLGSDKYRFEFIDEILFIYFLWIFFLLYTVEDDYKAKL